MLLLTVLVLEFESRRREILNLFSKMKKRDQLRLAWVSIIRRQSTREERAEFFSR